MARRKSQYCYHIASKVLYPQVKSLACKPKAPRTHSSHCSFWLLHDGKLHVPLLYLDWKATFVQILPPGAPDAPDAPDRELL